MDEDTRIAGRGLEFSAAYRRQQAEQYLVEGTDYVLPLRQRIEDGVDTHGLQQASASLPIPPDNKGYLLLQKMGWKGPGQGLGKKSDGLREPVDLNAMDAGMRLGLGKMQQDAEFTAAENINRKQLEAEIQMNEDEDRKEKRLERVEQQARIQEEVKKIRQTFYCEVCDKQYKYAAELEEHLSSYSHHHTKRLREMKKMEHDRTREQRERKALKRSQKEMARLDRQVMAAHGAQQPANPPLPTSTPPPLPPDAGTGLPNTHGVRGSGTSSTSQGGWSSSFKEEPGGWGESTEPAGGGGWGSAPVASGAEPSAAPSSKQGQRSAGGSAVGLSFQAGAQPTIGGQSPAQGRVHASSQERGHWGTGGSGASRWDHQPSSAPRHADNAAAGTRHDASARASRWDRQPSHAARNAADERPLQMQAFADQPPLPPEPPSSAFQPPPPPPPAAAPQAGFALSFSLGGSGSALGAAFAKTGLGSGLKSGGGPAFAFSSAAKPAPSSRVSAMFGDDDSDDVNPP